MRNFLFGLIVGAAATLGGLCYFGMVDFIKGNDALQTCREIDGASFSHAEYTVREAVDCHYDGADTERHGPVCNIPNNDYWITISEGLGGHWIQCSESRTACTFTCGG